MQSSIIMGMNFSISDALIMLLFLYYLYEKKFYISKSDMLFIILLIAYRTMMTFVWVNAYSLNYSLSIYFKELLRLLLPFSFYLFGKQLNKEQFYRIIKIYTKGSLVVSTLVIIQSFVPTSILSFMMFGGYRVKGLMNDPNYFSLIQMIALILLPLLNIKKIIEILFECILVFSIILSGSKGATITLIIFYILRVFIYIFKTKTFKVFIFDIICIFVILSLIYIYKTNIHNFFVQHVLQISSFNRILGFFETGDLNSGGSGREVTWKLSMNIAKNTSFLGTGFGTYLLIGEKKFGIRMLSHNTFLQILSEWGLVFFSVYFFKILKKISEKVFMLNKLSFTLSILFCFILIMSFGLSLNNSRIWWFFLGIISNNKLNACNQNIEYRN